MERSSRFSSARRSLRLARYAVVAGSAAAFGGFALVARGAHAGKSTTSSPASQAAVTSDDAQAQTFDYGASSLAPSNGGGGFVQSGGS